MSRHEDVLMHVSDRMREMSREDYAYYMDRRGCSDSGYGYVRDSERRGRRGNDVKERGEYGWDFSKGESNGRVRSRSPQRRYHEVSRRGAYGGHNRRHESTPPPFHPGETCEPAPAPYMISPCFTDSCKYAGEPASEAGPSDHITFHRRNLVAVDNSDVTHESEVDSRMVRPHQFVQPVSSYGETSRHFHTGKTNTIVDKRDQHRSYLSIERSLNFGSNKEDDHLLSTRDASYPDPVCSKSQANVYASTSPASRDAFHSSSHCHGDPKSTYDDLCSNKSVVLRRSVFDAYEGHPAQYSTSDHHNYASSVTHMKSTRDSIQHLHYHYPTIRSEEKGELGHLSDVEYRTVNAGFSQTHRQRSPGIGVEAKRYDESNEALCQHAKKECYNARLPLTITNKNEDNYISDCSFKDRQLSHHVSHDRGIHSDRHSCLSHPESCLHSCMDHDYKDPHFGILSDYDPGCIASRTWVDNHHNLEENANCTNSRADLMYNAEETREDCSVSRLWRPSIHNKQGGEQNHYASKVVSSTEPRDKFVDCRMYDPDISSKIKQYGAHFDLSSPEKEQRLCFRDSEIESLCPHYGSIHYGSVYDVNATPDYDMVVGRLDANMQTWVENDPIFHAAVAPDEMVETDSFTYSISGVVSPGGKHSHRRCNASSSRYLPDRNEILSEKEMIIHLPETTGVDRSQLTGSRSIFDRLGSPQGSIDRLPRRHIQGHLISQQHEPRQIKDHRKSNHLTLKRFHPSRGGSFNKHSSSSNTDTDEGHIKTTDDTDTLKDVELPLNPVSHDNSGDFSQSIQKAFLLISLKINENPATRMRYKGQGKAGTLFCIICKRSNSKEFRVARDLAAHSLTCQKSGLRASHLGLFKAICVTMGWNSDINQQSGMWTPQILSEEKALAQKEDLICWPPIFVVHNVYLLRKSRTAPKVLTVEELEAFFRRKGFINGRVKVCLGRSTNDHIMIIKFLGTFPGLKDAERLHKYFAESKHGRVEFWKLANTNAKVSQSQPCVTDSHSDNTEMPDLYGYMGIAEDWGKLDTESKKRCTLKSKQEVLHFSAEPILAGAS